ncbi:MAG: hypothetical protein ABIS69_00650 [Sediminibacterium sp.]
MRKFLLPVTLGFAAMFVAHILLFILSIGGRLHYTPYIIAYPIVYSLLAFILAINNPKGWFSNVYCILLIPFIYWYILLGSDGKFHWADAIKVRESSSMLLVLPFTFLMAVLISFTVFRQNNNSKKSRKYKA